MRGLTSVLLSLPVLALAGSHHIHRRHHHWMRDNTTITRRANNYKLTHDISGEKFFDYFDFFTSPDPTHGTVNYVSQSDAQDKGLIGVGSDGTVKIAVDDFTTLSPGQNRDSVRIQSKDTWNTGLMTFDVASMPSGCSLWPALWLVGPDWPNNGEIDIIEGVNLNDINQVTLHTGPTCSIALDDLNSVSGRLGNPACSSTPSDNRGCFFNPGESGSFGAGFNNNGGGVYAMDWQEDFIKVWFWPRATVPQDIYDMKPEPGSWGKPTAVFSSGAQCAIGDHFHDNRIVINTSICGDWAGAAFSAAGCGTSCNDYVANPSNFANAKWKINSIRVYQS